MRLWLYFILFTAVIFTVLWLLQTVFIQSFYNNMLIDNTRSAAQKIAQKGYSSDLGEVLDEMSLNNSILIYITDTKGNILFSSDQFKGAGKKHGIFIDRQISGSEELSFPHEEKHPDAGRFRAEYRSLPDDYNDFLTELEASDSGVYENTRDGLFIYGTYIMSEDNEKYVLYVSTTLDAVGPAVDIIRIQLIWGTVISIIIGFALAWFIAKKFSKPVAGLTRKAESIGSDNFPKDMRRGFCKELDELSDVLDETDEKLKKSRDFQRELLANVSHDLRTPLTMIKGYAEMVRDISREDEEQCREDLGVIIREADRLSAMVNEILEYSEMQSAEYKPESEPVDLSAAAERVCASFESLYSREGGRIEKDIEKGIIVRGNSGKLERAIYNLLDNAVRHNGESKLINVSLSAENNKAKLCITDHGDGIPPEELENIWDRYYTYRQREKKGVSGLGLAIVQQTARSHGGSCYAESTIGKGSSFIILLDTI